MTDVTKKSWYNDIVEKIYKVTFDIDFAESPFAWNDNCQKAPLMGVFWWVKYKKLEFDRKL